MPNSKPNANFLLNNGLKNTSPVPRSYANGVSANQATIANNVETLLQVICGGSDGQTLRSGLLETPNRVAKAFTHWFGGYDIDVPALFKQFEDGAEGCNQMVIVKNIPFYSHCEHHLAPIIGTATVAYIPNESIVGLSKLNRVVDAYARRLQVQERITNQVADAINEHLSPLGVGVKLTARHLCMESRGVCQQGHVTVTTALRGVLLTDPSARHEFLSECK
ncbi:GTP cyclohydrolase I type 1 [Vibrio phage vB_VibM_83AMN]|nr:GTP cyclohydrolase I type 1 [Vibrio phage vB_VibM_83AMN]